MSAHTPGRLSVTAIVLAAVALVAAAGEFWFAFEMAVHIF